MVATLKVWPDPAVMILIALKVSLMYMQLARSTRQIKACTGINHLEQGAHILRGNAVTLSCTYNYMYSIYFQENLYSIVA